MRRKLIAPRLPQSGKDPEYSDRLRQELDAYFRDLNEQVNAMATGRIVSAYNAQTAAPSGVVLQVGDFVRRAAPEETGTASSKFILFGWMAKTAGTASAASIVEMRVLTGN